MTVVVVIARTDSPREDAGEHLGEVLHGILGTTGAESLEIVAWDQDSKPTRRQRAAIRTLLGNDNFVERELRR